jgi:hypothetical protein
VVANAANGNFVLNGNGNCDGTLLSVTGETVPYQVTGSGYMLIGTAEGGYLTGYIGNGRFIISSNPPGGVATDFASFVSLKKQDRSYTQQDLAGTWAIATFGDYNGQEFNTHFGTITCNSTGSCSASLTQKTSTGAISNLSKSFNLSVSQDGSLNNFYLTNNTPHFSGAIGNDGNVMILLMNPNGSSTNERLIGVAVKRNSVPPTISVSGKLQDPNGNFTSGIKVELAEDPTIFTYTDAQGYYTLGGVPSGQDFTLRFTMNGALPTYSPVFNFTTDIKFSRYFRLYPATWMTDVGNTPGKGIITGYVREDSANWENVVLSGVSLSATAPYTVEYKPDGGSFTTTSTFANGRWFVRNVNPGDIVTISAAKDGITIPSRKYKAFSDGVTTGSLFAKPNEGTIWVSMVIMTVKDSQAIAGATVAKVTNDLTGETGSPATTTNTDGSFTLGGLPSGSPFYLKATKAGFLPNYSFYNRRSNYNMLRLRRMTLWSQTDMTAAGVQAGKGLIKGIVINDDDPNEPPVEGVAITYTSSKGNTYDVKYYDPSTSSFVTGSSTYSNGYFFITNVEEGDNVTVNATKAGWTFSPRTYITHADSTVSALIRGTQTATAAYTIAVTVKDVSENPIQYATIKVWAENNNLIKESQTDQSGSYTIGLSSAGSYTIGVYREGYETITSPQIVYLSDSNPTAFVEFLMESAVEEALLSLSSGWNFISFP